MEKAVRVLRAPVDLIDRAEQEERLPPGTGLVIAFALSLVAYAGIVAAVA